jgi:hypothetical protein
MGVAYVYGSEIKEGWCDGVVEERVYREVLTIGLEVEKYTKRLQHSTTFPPHLPPSSTLKAPPTYCQHDVHTPPLPHPPHRTMDIRSHRPRSLSILRLPTISIPYRTSRPSHLHSDLVFALHPLRRHLGYPNEEQYQWLRF